MYNFWIFLRRTYVVVVFLSENENGIAIKEDFAMILQRASFIAKFVFRSAEMLQGSIFLNIFWLSLSTARKSRKLLRGGKVFTKTFADTSQRLIVMAEMIFFCPKLPSSSKVCAE